MAMFNSDVKDISGPWRCTRCGMILPPDDCPKCHPAPDLREADIATLQKQLAEARSKHETLVEAVEELVRDNMAMEKIACSQSI